MARLVVIGAGAMGLAAAYHAARAGHEVTVLEAGSEPGGMAAHFRLGELSIERFYHFICKPDRPTFDLLHELGIADKLRWRTTTMGHFSDGTLHPWGDPVALLRYRGLSMVARLRYGLFAWISTRRDRWPALEHQTAREWITRWAGAEVYAKLWQPLLALKFHRFADNVSAAWIWTRVKRLGRSRRSLFEERLGYLEGGSEILVAALVQGIERAGGVVRLNTEATRVVVRDGRVASVVARGTEFGADAVISTVPTPLVSRLVPDLSSDAKARYDAIDNIGVCCLVFLLHKPVSGHFWVNITDPAIPLAGIIEFSNLRPVDGHVVYVPHYMPTDHERFSWSDDRIVAEGFAALRRINPALTEADIVATRVSRLRHAQPICGPGFLAKLPAVQTPIVGLQVADTCFYYPEDRGIAESVRLGREMAARVAG
jgi:protoporphyrinogen oxidase